MTVRPNTVVIISDFAEINGGGAKVAIDSAVLLAKAGINVIFFAGSGDADESLSRENIKVISLGHADIKSNPNRLQAMTKGIWNADAAKALSAVLAEVGTQNVVVHVHSFAKVLSASIGRVIDKCGLPTVFTIHDYFLACPNGGFYDYQKNEICKRRPLGMGCLTTNCDVRRPAHKAWRVIRHMAMTTAGSMPSGLSEIIYISETQRQAIGPYLPSQARLHHLPNPVSIPKIDPVSSTEKTMFLFVGRLSPEKGGLLFAQAAAAAGVRAVIVGDGPQAEQIRKEFPSVEILGWQSPDVVAKYISQARCLVFSSLWYECQPLVPIEAIGLRVPVICGRWTAASETVVDGKNGILVEEATPEAFAAAMTALSVDEHPIFQAIQDRAQGEDNSPQSHIDGLLGIYAKLLIEDRKEN